MIVVDATVLATALTDDFDDGERARGRLRADPDLHEPYLADLEVLSVLRGLVLGGKLATSRMKAAARDLGQVQMKRYPHHPFAERILELRDNLTVYDAAYVALAEALDCVLVTADSAQADAPGVLCQVDVIK